MSVEQSLWRSIPPWLSWLGPNMPVDSGDASLRTLVLCSLSGALFFALEAVLQLVFLKNISRFYKRKNLKLTDGAARQAASQTVTRLLIAVHNFIQPDLQQDRIYASTPLSGLLIAISAGYFLHDLITTVPRVVSEPAYVIHAGCCFYVFIYALHTNILHYYAAAFLLWEISTPFVHLRWCLFKADMADTKLYVINGILMIVTFFACRNLWGTYTSWLFWQDTAVELLQPRPKGFTPEMMYGYRFANFALNGLNWYWFWKMIRGAVMLFLRGKRASELRGDKDD